MRSLKITTPHNPNYSGNTLGVPFNDGEARVHEGGKPNRWGYDLLALAERFSRHLDGYQVEIAGKDGEFAPYQPTGYPKAPPGTREAQKAQARAAVRHAAVGPRGVVGDVSSLVRGPKVEAVAGRACPECGTALSAKNKTGYCVKHWRQAVPA